MIKVNKASAGSGKTYTLANTYIDLLKGDLDYRHILAVTFTNKATAEMKERILKYLEQTPQGRKHLTNILHDYSAFSISTIDRFFQRALKAFAREIGGNADYKIELEKKTLIEEAMGRVLESLSNDESSSDILAWILDNVFTSLDEGEKPSIDQGLKDMGEQLLGESRRTLRDQHAIGDEEFSIKRLSKVREKCRLIIKEFTKNVKAAALDLPVYGKKYADNQRLGYCNVVASKEIEAPKSSLAKEAAGTPFMLLFEEPFKNYLTAFIIEKQLYSFGLAREFFKQFSAILNERNILPIDDSNALLKRIISGSDAPFVYEKLGVRYEHFLLDEFQDTSLMQWENFLPLLAESNSSGHSSLIVGDVKQSIYRWRNSDWRLLSEKVQEAFPGAKISSMQNNYRSCSSIINFNNSFFPYAASYLGLSDLYSDVCQNVSNQKEKQCGYVQISFCDQKEEIQKVLESIATALEAGAQYSDIAVLVRNNAEGSAIAQELIVAGYPVVSDDSLEIGSSLIVKRLISLLSCIDNPSDSINQYIVKDAQIDLPTAYTSLIDLCEGLLRQLQVAFAQDFTAESSFILAFMDTLREWAEINGHNLRFFLEYFKEKKRFISAPKGTNAINILTVHKSKGLEFPYLIFPFAEKVDIYKASDMWCYFDAPKDVYGPEASGIYSVNLSSKVLNSYFKDDYLREVELQKVDNLNIFYVALTRAKCCLHVIASMPGSSTLDKTGCVKDCKNLSHILYNFVGGFSNRVYGKMYDFSRLSREEPPKAEVIPAQYCSIDLCGRLIASTDAFDFFAEDGSTGINASARRSGMALHAILAKVKSPSDLDKAVKEALLDGTIDGTRAEEVLQLLSNRIASQKQFFELEGYNEVSIFDSHGCEYRPDRVIIKEGKVSIIDYKFGAEEEKYHKQVRNYMRLYREMGYQNIEGYLWYVVPNKLVRV